VNENQFNYAINTNIFPKSQPFHQTASLLAKLKVQGVEWGLSSLETAKSDAKEMAKVSNENGLAIVGFINAGNLTKTDQIEKWSEAVANAGGTMLRVSPFWVAWNFAESLHQPESFPQMFAQVRSGLERLIPLGQKYQLRYVVEMHPGNIIPSAELARKLFDGLDPKYVGAIYDPANGIVEGHLRPRTAVELLGPYLAYVHVKNLCWEKKPDDLDDQGCLRAKWEIKNSRLDEGILDWVEVFFALKSVNFKGWLSIEEFSLANPEIELAQSLTFLKNCERVSPKEPCEPFTKFNI
jgi:sugar phosphate isomerase/epimerase